MKHIALVLALLFGAAMIAGVFSIFRLNSTLPPDDNLFTLFASPWAIAVMAIGSVGGFAVFHRVAMRSISRHNSK